MSRLAALALALAASAAPPVSAEAPGPASAPISNPDPAPIAGSELDLAALIREAAGSHPALAAAKSRIAAAEAAVPQAEALPDPLASFAWQNESLDELSYGESMDSWLAVSWQQEVPGSGRRSVAADLARGEAEVSRARAARAAVEIAASIKEAYAGLWRIDATGEILRESRSLLAAYLDAIRSRYEAGEGLLENLLKAQAEISRLDLELESLAAERAAGAARLGALVGRTGAPPSGRAGRLPEPAAIPPVEAIEAAALAAAPEIAEREAEASREEARARLAVRQKNPDWMWGASYMSRGGLDPMVQGTVGVRLPIFRDRRQNQAIVQARHEAEAARAEAAASRLSVAAEVRSLFARAGRAASLRRSYAESLVPQGRSALEAAAAAYASGKADFGTLLQDFNALLAWQIDGVGMTAERFAALAGLERLSGMTLVPVEPPSTGGEGARHD